MFFRISANTKGSLISKSYHDVSIFESWFPSWFRRPFARWRAFLARFSACPAMGGCVKSAGNLQNLIAFHYLGAPSCMIFHLIIIGKPSKGQPWFGVNHPIPMVLSWSYRHEMWKYVGLAAPEIFVRSPSFLVMLPAYSLWWDSFQAFFMLWYCIQSR